MAKANQWLWPRQAVPVAEKRSALATFIFMTAKRKRSGDNNSRSAELARYGGENGERK
jgi:hypothetical protein